MDILLVNPARMRSGYVTEHLGLASLSAFLTDNNIANDILDLGIEKLSIKKACLQIILTNPKILGVSLLDATKKCGLKLICLLRQHGYDGKIVVGGYFPTFSARDILHDFQEIDFVVRGEGELTLLALVQNILGKTPVALNSIQGLSFREKNKIINNPPRPLIRNLDILPPSNRKYASNVIKSGSHLRVAASRGCWGKCSFCEIIGFYGTASGKAWRRRSVSHFVDELEDLHKKYHSDYFIFNDDQFLVKGIRSLKYIELFAQEIERRGLKLKFEIMCRADTITYDAMRRLKSVGLQRVFLGIESFDAGQLKRYNKGISVFKNIKAIITLRKLEINVIVSVILADAYTTISDLFRQMYTLVRLRQKFASGKQFQISFNNRLEIFPGSKLFQEYADAGLITRNNYLTTYLYKINSLIASRLAVQALISQFKVLIKEFIYRVKCTHNLIRFKKPIFNFNWRTCHEK